jgi:hypothetical protein
MKIYGTLSSKTLKVKSNCVFGGTPDTSSGISGWEPLTDNNQTLTTTAITCLFIIVLCKQKIYLIKKKKSYNKVSQLLISLCQYR